jgi:hypothetical protein
VDDVARPSSLSRVAAKLPVCCLDTSSWRAESSPDRPHPLAEARRNDVGTRVLPPTDRRLHHPVLLDVSVGVFGPPGTDRRARAARDGTIEGLS